MIPIMILFGLCFGRWWRTTLIAAALIWPLMLVDGEVMGLEWGLVSAAGLAVANTAAGVLLHQAILGFIRGNRHSSLSSRATPSTLASAAKRSRAGDALEVVVKEVEAGVVDDAGLDVVGVSLEGLAVIAADDRDQESGWRCVGERLLAGRIGHHHIGITMDEHDRRADTSPELVVAEPQLPSRQHDRRFTRSS